MAFCLGVAGLVTAAFIAPKPAARLPKNNFEGKGFAVVELFTSEGCSSCPAADAVVAKIEKESAGKPVYILAYHVDYWNRLGWKDPFSSADYSRRQNTYANWLHLRSIYTPQVVVNGRTEFVGSQEGTLRNAINAGINKAPKADLAIDNIKTTGGKASFNYTAGGETANTGLLFALVQKNATTVVKSGENGGRTLSHVQIVDKLQAAALTSTKTGEANIALPKGFDAGHYELIALLQNNQTGEIMAATRFVFNPAASAI